MPNGWRTIKSLVHKIRLHGRRRKGMAESFSREKLGHAPQKGGGWEILCDLPPVWPRLVRPTNLMSRMNGKKTHTHIKVQHYPCFYLWLHVRKVLDINTCTKYVLPSTKKRVICQYMLQVVVHDFPYVCLTNGLEKNLGLLIKTDWNIIVRFVAENAGRG